MSVGEAAVGFSQLVRLEWFDQTVAMIRAGHDRAAVLRALDAHLAGTLSVGSRTRRNSRAKTLVILLKIWFDGPRELAALRASGLDLLGTLPPAERVAVYWGMTQAAYPFWGAVAAQVGRLLHLQGQVAARQIQQRMREALGDRQTVRNATQRVLRSCVDWGVLADTQRRGVYAPGARVEIADPRLAAWLAEALLARGGQRIGAGEFIGHPSLYPFRIAPMQARELAAHSAGLGLLRHGFGEDLLIPRAQRGNA